MANLPYVQVIGTLETMLQKIQTASVPEKFSQDFVSTKLSMKGGSARAIIPFIKKMGLVSTDGTPTERYNEFRNPDKAGIAIANAMRELYETLFEMNEYVYELDGKKLKGLIVQATGSELNSTPVKKTFSTFNALKAIANFDSNTVNDDIQISEKPNITTELPPSSAFSQHNLNEIKSGEGINLSYTINLNLPATTEIEVFNAIFKSIKQHLLQE